MTARLTTTLGALVLGLAAFAATPVLAQSGGGNVPSGTPSTTNAGEGHTGPDQNATKEPTATSGTLGQSMVGNKSTHHAARHPVHRVARHASEGDTAAGRAAVARLNEQSLQAAQQGRGFTPSAAPQQ